ncbi:MAG TPA: hypothetical protein VE567_03875 [Sphingomonas sp.]|nr:hypothetical protein [Sphingomonas sp.]
MPDPLLTNLLRARRYESADPATSVELAQAEAIAELDRLLVEKALSRAAAPVVPLRAGGRR